MAIALVVSTKVTPAGGSGGTSPSVDTTGANLIVIGIAAGSGTSPTVTDNKSNTYTGLGVQTGTFNFSQLYYCLNPTVGSGHTFTTGGGFNQSMSIAAYSGVKTSGAFDQQNGVFQNTTSTTVQTGSITPSQNGCLVITTLGVPGAAGATFSINSSLTVEQQLTFSAGNYYGNGLADYIQPTAGAINPTWTVSSAPLALTATIASFLPGGTSASFDLVGVSATADVGTLTAAVSASGALSGVSGTAAAGTLGLAVDSTVSLVGVSATAAVGTLSATAGATFALEGVSATAYAGDVTPASSFLCVPMITIMNDYPIPVDAEMTDDTIPGEGDLPYQIAFDAVINTNPIPMTGTLSAVPVPAEGSVP